MKKNKVIDRLNEVINKRPVGVIAHGGSIKELEERIEEFKDLDICWVSLNNFDIPEEFILNKVNKKFEMIFKFASLAIRLEKEMIPKVVKVLERGGLFVTGHSLLVQTHIRKSELNKYYKIELGKLVTGSDAKVTIIDDKYKNNFLSLNDLISKYSKCIFESVECSPNNSLCYILYTLSLTNTKKIILFGFDGYSGNIKLKGAGTSDFGKYAIKEEEKKIIYQLQYSYYKPKIFVDRKDKESVIKDAGKFYINCLDMNKYFLISYENFKKAYNVTTTPEIINCSPNSMFNIFRKITYDQLKKEVNG